MSPPALPNGVLSGVRVLDFTWYAVGPWSVRLLSHFGAEVIHIERADSWDDHRFDLRHVAADQPQQEWRDDHDRPYYTAPYYSTLHHGKLAISLNARHPEGLALLKRLVAMSDAVAENFTAGVLESWGLGWEQMREINPKIVYLSVSGYGHSGEWSDRRSLGPTAQAQGGLTLASGLPGQSPAGWGYSHMDIMGGWIGGMGLSLALLQAKRTGKGMYVDYCVSEAATAMLGTYCLDYQVNGRGTRRPDFPPGNRSPFPPVAPHNTYRCGGQDRVGQYWWVFIACETQQQFEALCAVMKQPDLALDPRFATMAARVAHQDELDAIIGRWTAPRRRYEIMHLCQKAGIIAAVVQGAEDKVDYDPQLLERDVFQVIDHPEVGEFKYEAYPVRLSGTPPYNGGRSPTIREHNEYVFGELLKLSEAERQSLAERGVI